MTSLHRGRTAMRVAPVLLFCALAATAARGEDAKDFPPGQFTDGGSYSLEDFKGKALVLYFYEKG